MLSYLVPSPLRFVIKHPKLNELLFVFLCRNDTGVFVSDVVKGGVAEADGRLQPGDQILSVNGEDLKNATQEIAAGVLKVKFSVVSSAAFMHHAETPGL